MYQPRLYRERLNQERFKTFTVKYLETDLWLAVDKESYQEELPIVAADCVIRLRKELESYIKRFPAFKNSLNAIPIKGKKIPRIALEMMKVAKVTGIGPLSAVAGAFSFFVAEELLKKFQLKELIIENGGDLYVKIVKDISLKIFPGELVLKNDLVLKVKADLSPLGICTSAGKLGHSLNFGESDAVMIACKNPLLADSYATALSNQVKGKNNISGVLEKIKNTKEIISSVIIAENSIGICGNLEIKAG